MATTHPVVAEARAVPVEARPVPAEARRAAAARPLAPVDEPTRETAAAPVVAESAAGQALVPVARPAEGDEQPAFGPAVARLPVELDIAVPVREFLVRHLLALAPGQVIESQWSQGNDVPLTSGDVQLAWSEFEVVETQLAVRVTRLA
jgi:flagellar motor switch/type III secretory pathway protein FliN